MRKRYSRSGCVSSQKLKKSLSSPPVGKHLRIRAESVVTPGVNSSGRPGSVPQSWPEQRPRLRSVVLIERPLVLLDITYRVNELFYGAFRYFIGI